MFTIEIKINGSLIGHIYGRNTTAELYCANPEKSTVEDYYKYEYYEPETRELIRGDIKHIRADGIRPLIIKILNNVERQVKAHE
jgi:hypothetical protein